LNATDIQRRSLLLSLENNRNAIFEFINPSERDIFEEVFNTVVCHLDGRAGGPASYPVIAPTESFVPPPVFIEAPAASTPSKPENKGKLHFSKIKSVAYIDDEMEARAAVVRLPFLILFLSS
jgi:hypothetical protein